MNFGPFHRRRLAANQTSQQGYALMVIMFIMTTMMIAALSAAPRMLQQVHRDREEEMIHRGVQYTRAIKRYYKKFGSYPSSLQQLESVNNNRFIRKAYKDPFAKDGQWKPVRFGEIQLSSNTGIAGGANLGVAASQLAAQSQMSGANAAQLGAAAAALGAAGGLQALQQAGASGLGGMQSGLGGPGGLSTSPGGLSSSPGLGASTASANPTASAGSAFSNPASSFGSQATGGGAIIGVASTSGLESVRVIDAKNHYKDWKFVYDPALDRQNVLINGPYSTKLAKLMATVNVNQGQQLGQPIGANGIGNNNNSGFGQSNFNQNGFGQSGMNQQGFGQQGLGQSGFGQQSPSSFGQGGYAPPAQPVR